MANRTSSSIEIAASPETVMEVIADFHTYPEWVESLTRADVIREKDGRAAEVRMVLEHPVISDDYTVAYTWTNSSVSWRLLRGQTMKAMNGSYALTPSRTGTKVTYTLQVDVKVPMIGLLKRKAEKTIVDGALQGLKQRVESR